MLKSHRLATYGLAVMLALALLTPSLAPAQGGKKGKAPEVKSDSRPGSGAGQDENIKNPSEKNDPSSVSKAPSEKGGEKTRQATCRFHVDNRTPYKIQIFVDGAFAGMVSDWGDAWGTYGGGAHTLYGRARFPDPKDDKTWGPTDISCFGTHNWRLTDTKNGYL